MADLAAALAKVRAIAAGVNNSAPKQDASLPAGVDPSDPVAVAAARAAAIAASIGGEM